MRYSLAITLLLSAFAGSAVAQSSAINGQILGTVTDPAGAVVSGAKVSVLNVQNGFRESAQTNASGLYRFNLLPLGEYEINVEMSGFAPVKLTGVSVSAGSVVTVDVLLSLKGVTQEVVVTGAAPIIDPSRVDQSSSLGQSVIVNLPLVSRNPYNFILQQPNVSGRGNTEFGVPRKVNANGFNGRVNYQLDGSNNVQSDRTGIRLLPVSNTWVQEIQTLNNGFAPEFGNTVGTVFNTITKSGSNQFHGEGGYLWRRTPYSARPSLLAADRPTPEVNVDSYFGNGGGRIVKDKLFLFGAYEKVKRDLPNPVSVTAATLSQLGLPAEYANAVPFRQNVTFFLVRADYQLNDKHRLVLRYNGHRNDSPYNNAGGLTLVSQSYNFVDRSHAGAVQLISTLSPSLVNEFRFQAPFRSQQQNQFEANVPGPSITISGVANFGNSPNTGFAYDEMTPEMNNALTWNRGAHTFKFGGALRWVRSTQVQATNAIYTFPSIAAYLAAKNGTNPKGYATFAQTVGNPSISYPSLFGGWFAQDSWKPRANLTVTFGLRHDVYRPPQANSESPFAYSKSFRTDKNNLAPRAGVAWSKGKWVMRASGGLFYDPFQTDQYRKSILNNGTPIFFSINTAPTTSYAPSFPNVFSGIPAGFSLALQDITTVDPGFATLYSVSGNASVSRQISANLGVTATYLYTRGNHLPVWRNINVGRTGATLLDGRAVFGGTRPITGFNNILAAESVGQSTYNGLNLAITKRYGHGFEAFGSYTWSHAIDDAPEQNNIDSAAAWLSDSTDRRRDRADSITDRRHAFNGNAVWNPTFDLSHPAARYLVNNNRFAFALTLQQGENFNMGSNRVLNGDTTTTAAFQRPLFIPRNSLRAPVTAEWNARYSRVFPIKEQLRAEFFAESTNILNRTNVTGINSTATVDTLGWITTPASRAWTSAMDQRLIQFGIKAVW